MRVYRDGVNAVLETVITDTADKFTAELNIDKISILNTFTGLYEVFEMLWSDIKDINNASLADAAATKSYLDSIFKTKSLEIDEEGRQIFRRATSKVGWHYSAICPQFCTSSLTVFDEDVDGNALNQITVKLYDVNGTEITDQATADTDCVKTVVTIKPPHDYEVIEGDVYHHTRPTQDIRLWTFAGIPELGSVKEFVQGLNLRFMSPDDHIQSDGRSSKFMVKDVTGVPYPANQFQFILKHPAGVKHEVMIILETYKA